MAIAARTFRIAAVLAASLVAATAQAAGTLRVGIAEDPDILDPARSGSYVGRILFAALCDKLVDIDAKLAFTPQLATKWEWSADNMALTVTLRPGVKFHDGEAVDAEAVRINLTRYQSAPESVRKGEVKPIAAIEVVDPLTLRLKLAQPYAPLVAVLADRAGMMMSPKALARLGAEVSKDPVCAGPFKFTERVAQDHITFDRFPGYWDAGRVHLDRIVYRPYADSNIRLINLQSGQLDLIERMPPSDATRVKADPKLRLLTSPAIAYQSLFINLAHGPMADNPLGKDARVREAFEKSIDRVVLNQVIGEGMFVPSNQAESPSSPYWNAGRPVPPRDLAGAKALLKAAGYEKVSFELLTYNAPIAQQTAELIQAMAGEAGFDIKLKMMEANAATQAAINGEYQMTTGIWSGRADPDGNIAIWLAKDGFLNWGRYDNPALDALLVKARGVTDVAARKGMYAEISDIYLKDRPFVVMYHQTWLFGTTERLSGFAPVPDGLLRPQGIQIRQ
ncbi:MAG: ABC transporter substrate-binding protein [Alphaproteobacteria bacterium]|nr:ABC transporter substrate-binding protein [Alphaproteobacteria bacterium]